MVYGAIEVNTYTPSKDFTVSSPYNEVSICSCSTKFDTVTVTNTGTWPAIFTITANEIISKLTISDNSFELSPGQSKDVFLYITADCSKGSEDLKITVTSNLGPQKFLEKKILRDRCQNIEMWATNYTQDVNPCESKNFDINIHNIGPFADTYTIESNYDKYITYNANNFNLESSQYAKITATAKFDCNIYGQKDIIFTVHSNKNKLSASLSAPLNIVRNYDYDLMINNDGNNTVKKGICNRMSSTQVPVVITNKGSVANNYTIQVSGLPKNAKLVNLNDLTVNLAPGQSKTFYIDVDSTVYRFENKNNVVTVKVVSALGDIDKESKLTLNFMSCYEHQIIKYDYGNSQKYPLRTCQDIDYGYDIKIENKGSFLENYTLSLFTSEGNVPSTIKLSKTSMTLQPGTSDMTRLLITGPATNEDYDIKLKVTSGIGISEYADVYIKSYDEQSCHATAISKSEYRVNYQTPIINIPIKNNGLVDNAYIISWSGSDIVDAQNVILLNVNRSQKGNIALNINSWNKNESIYQGKLTVREASGAKYTQDIHVQLKDKSVIRKTFEYLAFGNTCRQFSLYEMIAILLTILLIIIFLIVGPHYPYKFSNRFKTKTSALVFLIVLFLVGLILVITAVGLPKTEAQVYNLTTNNTGLRYEWLQDGKYVLDVSKFFYSPENSTLKYDTVGLKNIKTVINGNSITFYPNLGWSGVEKARIIATDKMGDTVTSPEFTLIVRNVPRKSMTELYNIYCWYVNLAIFAILLVFIFLAIFVKQKKRTRK